MTLTFKLILVNPNHGQIDSFSSKAIKGESKIISKLIINIFKPAFNLFKITYQLVLLLNYFYFFLCF